MPNLGSSGSGYAFAKAFGHQVIEPFPSLVQCVCEEAHVALASGVKMEGVVELFVENQKVQRATGDLLFTAYGLSGSAILEISRKVSLATVRGEKVHVVLDLMPTLSKEALQSLLQKRVATAQGKSLSLWLEGMIPKKLALLIIHHEKLLHVKEASELSAKELKKLVFALKALRLSVTKTKGFESAEVCAGGVELRDIETKSLQSRRVENLYFCGEVLDVDGNCGGFNLHFAWASGFCVGQSL